MLVKENKKRRTNRLTNIILQRKRSKHRPIKKTKLNFILLIENLAE